MGRNGPTQLSNGVGHIYLFAYGLIPFAASLARIEGRKGAKMETIVAVSSSASPSDKLISSSSSLLPHGFLFPSSSPRRLAVAPSRRQTRAPLRAAAALGRRRTLSEGWDLSGSVPGAFRMPRFEEMDTTNTLLRQRIVFLGSQVLRFSLISPDSEISFFQVAR